MKLTRAYGTRLAEYEGAVYIGTGDTVQAGGYFEAVQARDGTLAVSLFFSDVVHFPLQGTAMDIKCVDLGGWSLQLEGDLLYPTHRLHNIHGVLSTSIVVRPNQLRAKRMPDHDLRYLGTRFAVANLILGYSDAVKPDPIHLSLEGRDVEIHPSQAYLEQAERLRAIPDVEVTTIVNIKTSDGVRHSLDEDVAVMDALIPVLRLWSGNKLDWVYGEGMDDDFNSSVEMVHKNAIVGGYSNTLTSLGYRVDLIPLVQAFLAEHNLPLGFATTRNLISYFVDACAVGPYLEVRALSAATLLDTLALKYSEYSGTQNIMLKTEFRDKVLRGLREAINSTLMEDSVKKRLINNLQGLYRTSFRERIKFMNDELVLGMNGQLIDRVKKARDTLVHEGRFRSGNRTEWWNDYTSILWTDLVTLCRLVGYDGPLPSFLFK